LNESSASPDSTPVRLLLVDDEAAILASLKRLFRPHGYAILTATSGQIGLEILEKEPVDLVISDMRMPEMDGAQFLEQVAGRWPETKRILLTGYSDTAATIAAINLGKIWRYVAKPWNAEEIVLIVQQALAHRRLLQENARLLLLTQEQNEQLKALNTSLEQKVVERTVELSKALQALQEVHGQLRQGFVDTVRLFSSLVELRGGKLAGHSRRVADTARHLARHLGSSEADQQDVLLAALLHDIGKIGLPDDLLNAPFNTLTPQGKIEVMRHPAKGQEVLMGVKQLANAARLIRHHHEWMDGSGYPDQLIGTAIPLGARILAVANDYDALQMGALTQHHHTPSEARKYIVKESGRRYDPEIVVALLATITEDRKERAPKASPQSPNEVPLTTGKLKPGMVLSRDLIHKDGYLLVAQGGNVDETLIVQLREFERANGEKLSIFIRMAAD